MTGNICKQNTYAIDMRLLCGVAIDKFLRDVDKFDNIMYDMYNDI